MNHYKTHSMSQLLVAVTLLATLFTSTFSSAEGWVNFNDVVDDKERQAEGIATSNHSSSNSSHDKPTDTKTFAEVAKRYQDAVAVVVIAAPNGERIPYGTAWAAAPGKFATNAHITEPVKKFIKKGLTVQVQLNNSLKIYDVTAAKSHPAYQDGKFDVGVLTVSKNDHPVLKVASTKRLKQLSSGEEMALIGFPMENLQKNNINIDKPLASVQIGNLVALSDFTLKDAGFDNNYQVRHSIPATGGASGSPIFTQDGNVVAVLRGGNVFVDIDVDYKTGKAKLKRRMANAALINFGVRVDLINDLL